MRQDDFSLVLGIEPMALHMLGKYWATELQLQYDFLIPFINSTALNRTRSKLYQR